MPIRTHQSAAGQVNSRIDNTVRTWISHIHVDRGIGRMLVLLVIAFALFAVLNPRVFMNPLNLQNIMVSAPEVGILAIAMTLAMLTGGIDLSLVSIANLTAITISTMYTGLVGSDPALAESLGGVIVLVGIAVGVLAGLINAFLISTVGITPILATLATMQIFNGIAIVWTGGKTLYGAPQALSAVGKSTVAGVPVLFLLFLVVAIVIGLLVNRTPFGRKTQLQGANPTAARFSGIRSASVLYGTYLTTGLLGGLAGVLFVTRNPTASADYGTSYVLLVIVIAVLGGTNPMGGFATVTGVVLATLVLQVVQSGFNAIRLSSYEYSIAQGVILIGVMVFDQLRFRRRTRYVASTQTRNIASMSNVGEDADETPDTAGADSVETK
ncbi:ABC transporter permease [Microbacterium sp. MPKO10]|uniref:ABC transporter permease n=1 Tax=Microbacterium sp. MPKO10 TaxID=2989818 RepID=UPI002235D095|nr:ABC transporter permease [Microbacterium sp. MPKO10]MCW4459915.1 ABC transporter permease [Microbacterium sp. MPKO10]